MLLLSHDSHPIWDLARTSRHIFAEDKNLSAWSSSHLYTEALSNSFFVGLTTTVPLATCGHGNVRLTPTRLPAPPITRTCLLRPCSRIAPSAQPVEAPAPRPRSGIACLRLWPELTVATGSSRSFFVHTALGYLCPCQHNQAAKPLLFGRTLTQYLITLLRTKHWAELLAPCC